MNSRNECERIPAIATEEAQVIAGAVTRDNSSYKAASTTTVFLDDANSPAPNFPPEGVPRGRVRFNKQLDVVLLTSTIAV